MVALLVMIRRDAQERACLESGTPLVWINPRKRGAARNERAAVTWKRGNVGFEVS
jgi:hypothetical protein